MRLPRKVFITVIFLLLFFIFLPRRVYSEEEEGNSLTQQEALCYSQCAAYRFFWRGDFCFDVISQMCSDNLSAIKTVSFIKNAYNLIRGKPGTFPVSIADLTKVTRAWLICKPLIEDCVVPVLDQCIDICRSEPLYFAPDLSVGSPDSNFWGVFFDAQAQKLYFKVADAGLGYAWDIDVKATYNHTKDRNGEFDPSEERQLFKTKIEHLIYLGARNGPPKSLGDRIGDFLIDEALNGQYLQEFKRWLLSDFKSDSNNYSIPNLWIKDYPFTPKSGELNRITFVVDPDNKIEEWNEYNNTFVLDIDLRPKPAALAIEDFYYQLKKGVINAFEVNFKVVNYGEQSTYTKIFIYEGEEEEYKNPIYDFSETIDGKETLPVYASIGVDPKNDDIKTCGSFKKYTLVVEDAEGKKLYHKFQLPIYAGEVHGLVKDLFGKPVVGAKVSASTGQETTTNELGYFNLVGIRSPGENIWISSSGYKVTITISHPDFSKVEEREVEFKMDYPVYDCQDGYLLHTMEVVLKDIDVNFKIIVYDKKTRQPLDNVYLVATNLEGAKEESRVEKIINGETPLPEIQPGKYFFTLSKAGYKTIGQTVNAVPENPRLGENTQILRFYLEKLYGRESDEDLVIFEKPQLLWEKALKGEIFVTMRITKDGKTVVFYTSKNQPDSGKLYFLETLSGKEKKIVSTISNGGISRASIGVSYDGNTTTLCSNDGKIFGDDRSRNWIKLFDSYGNLLGEKEFDNKIDTGLCEVSPDGYFIYPYFLMNKGFYEYTRFDTEGLLDYDRPSTENVTFGSYAGTHFTRENNVFGPGGGECDSSVGIRSIFGDKTIACFNDVENPLFSDSSTDSKSIIFVGLSKVYWFSDGQKIWEDEVQTRGNPLSVGITPGGEYVIYNFNSSSCGRSVEIVKRDGMKEISIPDQDSRCRGGEEVVYVAANDGGIFYASVYYDKLRLYHVGKYTSEYPPAEEVEDQLNTVITNLYKVEDGQYVDVPPTDFFELETGKIYYTRAEIHLNFGKAIGNLNIFPFTYFSVKDQDTLILLKGQLTVDFVSPVKIYAIKFDRFDLSLFKVKLEQFMSGSLPEEDYFLIKNVHTKFIVKNNINKINIAVENGEVEVVGKDISRRVKGSRQITIDKNNRIKETIFLGSNFYKICGIIFVCIIAICAVLLFAFRNTKFGKATINILKKLLGVIFFAIKKVAIFISKMLKFLVDKISFLIKNKKKEKDPGKK